jgi:hypothetical protein
MKKGNFFDEYPDFSGNREEHLEANASKYIEGDYHVPLTSDETTEAKDRLTELEIDQKKIRAKLESIKKDYKNRLKPIDKEIDELIDMLAIEARSESGKLYMFDDQEDGTMYTYDKEGNLINVRPLTPAETQTSIFTLEPNQKISKAN